MNAMSPQTAAMFDKVDRVERLISDGMGKPYHVELIGSYILFGPVGSDNKDKLVTLSRELELCSAEEYSRNAVALLALRDHSGENPNTSSKTEG